MAQYDDVEILEQKAANDLLVAEMIVDNNDELLEQAGFHLQQFVEKKIKAELHRRRVDYPWTHDLGALLKVFPTTHVSEDDKTFLYILSRFAVESRYNDYFKPPWDGRQMLERAKKFAEMTNN